MFGAFCASLRIRKGASVVPGFRVFSISFLNLCRRFWYGERSGFLKSSWVVEPMTGRKPGMVGTFSFSKEMPFVTERDV